MSAVGRTEIEMADLVGNSGASTVRARLNVAFSDPPGPYFVLIKVRESSGHGCSVDFGAGRFHQPDIVGAMTACPAGAAGQYDGPGPYYLDIVTIPEATFEAHREDLAVGAADLGPLHARGFVDPVVGHMADRLHSRAAWRPAYARRARGDGRPEPI
ncbi:MAG: hypothetical protein AAGF12_33560 [Myxococcota bacterium]